MDSPICLSTKFLFQILMILVVKNANNSWLQCERTRLLKEWSGLLANVLWSSFFIVIPTQDL